MTAFGFNVTTGTDQDLLDLVRQAIATILATGQSYTIRNRTFTRADITELTNIETKLQLRVTRATKGMSKNLVRFRRNP